MSKSPDLVRDVRSTLLATGRRPTAENVYAALRAERHVVDSGSLVSLVDQVRSELDGLGPIEPWVTAPGVTDILVNGGGEVWIDRGHGLERTVTKFTNDEALRRMVQRLVTASGRRLDDASPFVDVEVCDGLRLHAVLPPVSDRLFVSIRVPRRGGFTLDQLQDNGTLTDLSASMLRNLVASRRSFLISGGTGSGKTTVLTTLLGQVEHRHRLLIVEDTSELTPNHPHVVHLQSRTSNVEGAGAVTMRDLVRQALRMRPDRLVVGEARGAEIVDLMAALNTGHEGGCGTLHANSSTDVPARIEALASVGGMDRATAHSQMYSAIQAVVHVSRRQDQTRFVSECSVLERTDDGWVRITPAAVVQPDGVASAGPGWPRWQSLVGSAG